MIEARKHELAVGGIRYGLLMAVGILLGGMLAVSGCKTSTSLSQMAFTHRGEPWCGMYVGSMQEYEEPVMVVYRTTELGCAPLDVVEEEAKRLVTESGGSVVVPLPGEHEAAALSEAHDVE